MITGATGPLGSAVIDSLLKKNIIGTHRRAGPQCGQGCRAIGQGGGGKDRRLQRSGLPG